MGRFGVVTGEDEIKGDKKTLGPDFSILSKYMDREIWIRGFESLPSVM